ncbi:nucleotidyltransferase family protein [Cyanobacterium sp. Dongsha4]|uniref:nucleotidyltransferase family protein n=1 Tax=Cyanobacterium sp. DS4 TaxID=2878255 RepID=UPI002E816959|nr:nucleotidyltransferase domain-containing protein [Cyanobacterium sp. Dongsha4]WVL02333.1 nucleotidyltransferase domain-containing protein [Cyanobacterium sp. Dongsha4]
MLKLAKNYSLIYQRLKIKPQDLIRFCQENLISELAVFGSILRDDFNPQSDIDFLVTYSPLATRSLLEKIILKEKLEKMCGRAACLWHRPVDLVSKKAIENSSNWLKKQEILNSAEVIYCE